MLLKPPQKMTTPLREKLGWDTNPFDISCITQVDVRGQKHYKQLVDSINSGSRLFLVEGDFGVGKTYVLEQLKERPPKDSIVVFIGFGSNINIVTNAVTKKIHNSNPLSSFFFWSKPPTIDPNELPEYIEGKIGQKKLIIIWDEVHRAKDDWVLFAINGLRRKGSVFVFSGLKRDIDEKIVGSVSETSFKSRGIVRISLEPWTLDEKAELIKERIRYGGGEGLHPFTEDAIKLICARAKTPRDALLSVKVLFDQVSADYDVSDVMDVPVIDRDFVEDVFRDDKETERNAQEETPTVDVNMLDNLSTTEREIVEYMVGKDPLTTKEIARGIKQKSDAMRMFLKRIMEKAPDVIVVEGSVTKGRGRPKNTYRLSQDINAVLARK